MDLQPYCLILQQDISFHIKLNHEFLSLEEEAHLEQIALFTNPKNIKIIDTILHFHTNLTKYDLSSIVVVSVGTSSTQFYNSDRVLGAIYIGTDVIESNPIQCENLFQFIYENLVSSMTTLSAIIICNSISHFIEKTSRIDIMTESTSNDISFSSSSSSSDINNLSDVKKSNQLIAVTYINKILKTLHVPIILTTSTDIDSKLDNKWIKIIANNKFSSYPNEVYLIDFGGGGLDVYFFDPITKVIENIGKDRFLKHHQEAFLLDITTNTTTITTITNKSSSYIVHIKNSILRIISAHALTKYRSEVECFIYQTGQTRQVYFTNHSLVGL